MKKKGFTLIELLAVIVILAVIMVIAVPKILDVLEKSRLKALENSCYGIIDSAKLTYFKSQSTNTIIKSGNVDKLNFKGEKPLTGTWYINDNSKVIIKDITFKSMAGYICTNANTKNNKVVCTKDLSLIDNELPNIHLTGDFETISQNVLLVINVTDNISVDSIKYDKGDLDKSYFKNNGNKVLNKGIVKITENGMYTFYAKDAAGNVNIHKIEIDNIDENIIIKINESETSKVQTETTITIDYGDLTTPQYKIGLKGTYQSYSEPFALTSNAVIENNLQNEDFSVTICGKGIDSTGKENEICKKIYTIDLDAPSLPVIESTVDYPILTEYGVKVQGTTTITYDSRKDIDNYYSLDGQSWILYTGTINESGAMIYAKSVKKDTGLTLLSSIKNSLPNGSVDPTCFDEKLNTGSGDAKWERMHVSEEMSGKYIYIINNKYLDIKMYNASEETLKTYSQLREETYRLYIEPNTRILDIYGLKYEIYPDTYPKYNNVSIYPTLTSSGMVDGYNEISIVYDSIHTQKFYNIDNGEWQLYNNKTIKLDAGKTINIKGIDKNGKEYITTYKSTLPSNAVSSAAYDGKTNTGSGDAKTERMYVSEEMWGKYVYIINNKYLDISMYDASGKTLKTYPQVRQATYKLYIEPNTKILDVYGLKYEIYPE